MNACPEYSWWSGKRRGEPHEKKSANRLEYMAEKPRHLRYGRLGSLRYDVGIPPCQQKNCCALTALDGNGGGKPRALPWAVMWRPFRPCIRTAMLEKGGHGFTIDGTAQGLRYGR